MGRMSAIGKLLRSIQDRRYRAIPCAYGNTVIVDGERCPEMVDRWVSAAMGHPGFCSHEHQTAASEDALF